jgi:hypothetical protein
MNQKQTLEQYIIEDKKEGDKYYNKAEYVMLSNVEFYLNEALNEESDIFEEYNIDPLELAKKIKEAKKIIVEILWDKKNNNDFSEFEHNRTLGRIMDFQYTFYKLLEDTGYTEIILKKRISDYKFK